MIRPVFRSTLADWVGIAADEVQETSLFPNPVQHELQLRLPDNDDHCEYSILDITGKRVLTGISNNQPIVRISTDKLSTGSYILQYSNSKGEQFSTRFMKQ